MHVFSIIGGDDTVSFEEQQQGSRQHEQQVGLGLVLCPRQLKKEQIFCALGTTLALLLLCCCCLIIHLPSNKSNQKKENTKMSLKKYALFPSKKLIKIVEVFSLITSTPAIFALGFPPASLFLLHTEGAAFNTPLLGCGTQ